MPFSGRPKSSDALNSHSQYINNPNDPGIRESASLTFTKRGFLPGQQDVSHESGLLTPAEKEKTWPRRSTHSYHIRSDSHPHLLHMDDPRTSIGPTFAADKLSTRASRGSLSRKRSDGLRATLKRVFGNKRPRQPLQGVPRDMEYSDPGNLMSNDLSPSQKKNYADPSRSSHSLTRSITRSSALRSHMPGPPSPDPSHAAIDQTYPSKRRNTLPSLVLSDQEAQNFAQTLKFRLSQVEDPPPLPSNVSLLDKRRSRSLEAILRQQHSQNAKTHRQDRESAIAYWRKSIVDDPLPSMPDDLSHDEETDLRSDSPRLYRPPPQSIKPVQSFDFGLSVGDEPVELEDRVNTLEVKMFDFEYAIAKLQGVELPKPTLQPRIPRSKSSHDLLRRSHHSASTESSARRMMSFSRPRPNNASSNDHLEAGLSSQTSNSDTIRPRTSNGVIPHRPRSPSVESVRITRAEYSALMTLIQDEKAARQQMEMQIINLQKEVQQLQSPIFAAINYPTPQKESTQVPTRVKTLHRTSPFEFARTPPPSQPSRFSIDTDTEFQNDDYHEAYQTPRERLTFEMNRTSPHSGVPVS